MPLEHSAYGLGALLLGVLHAFEPGHGRVLMVTYLIGARGRVVDAVVLGLVATVTHTFTIVALAAAITFATGQLDQPRVQSAVEVLSATAVLAVGLWMLGRCRGGLASCLDFHSHGHEGADEGEHHGAAAPRLLGLGGVIAIGASAGIAPCPETLAVLSMAVNTGHVGTGVYLMLLFSLGLAAALVGLGLVCVKASAWLEQRFAGSIWERHAPVVTGVLLTVIGGWMLIEGLLHFGRPHVG